MWVIVWVQGKQMWNALWKVCNYRGQVPDLTALFARSLRSLPIRQSGRLMTHKGSSRTGLYRPNPITKQSHICTLHTKNKKQCKVFVVIIICAHASYTFGAVVHNSITPESSGLFSLTSRYRNVFRKMKKKNREIKHLEAGGIASAPPENVQGVHSTPWHVWCTQNDVKAVILLWGPFFFFFFFGGGGGGSCLSSRHQHQRVDMVKVINFLFASQLLASSTPVCMEVKVFFLSFLLLFLLCLSSTLAATPLGRSSNTTLTARPFYHTINAIH